MWENGIRKQTWRLKKNHLGRLLTSMRSFLRHGKRRASRANSSTKGHRLLTYGQPPSGIGNKNERPPRTRPFCSPGAIAAAASPLFRQPRRPHSDNPVHRAQYPQNREMSVFWLRSLVASDSASARGWIWRIGRIEIDIDAIGRLQ